MKNRSICQRFLFAFLSLLCAVCIVCGGCSAPQPGPPIVTKEEASQIKVGMTLEEAQKIIGNPGESPKVEGNPPITPHQWVNQDGSLLKVMLKDGRVEQIQPINFK